MEYCVCYLRDTDIKTKHTLSHDVILAPAPFVICKNLMIALSNKNYEVLLIHFNFELIRQNNGCF